MSYRAHPAPTRMLFGYDPMDLPPNHLARLVDNTVNEAIQHNATQPNIGQPAFDPRLCAKVLIYGYATGVRSSRQLERLCQDSLAFLLLTRGDKPSYRTLCNFRVNHSDLIKEVWDALFGVAKTIGLERLGRVVVDSSKFRADASPEAVIKEADYEMFANSIRLILKEAEETDAKEDRTPPGTLLLDKAVQPDQMREIIRAIRKKKSEAKKLSKAKPPAKPSNSETSSHNPEGGDPVEKEPTPATQNAEAKAVLEEAPLKEAPLKEVPRAEVSLEEAPLKEAPPAEAPKNEKDVPKTDSPSKSPAPAEPEGMQMGFAIEAVLGPQMIPRLKAALKTLEAAKEQQLKHACLTDPDARMMGEGRDKSIKECHSYEVVVDKDAGLLVSAEVITEHDSARLEAAVESAQEREPFGVFSIDADSGYYKGEAISNLESQGIDTCVPDGMTAKKMRCGELAPDYVAPINPTALRYDAELNAFVCAADKLLLPHQKKEQGGRELTVYRSKTPCTGCPLAELCFTNKPGKHRFVSRATDESNPVDVALSRFTEVEHQERYHDRGKAVETIFGFLRQILGFTRWSLRGHERVSAEAVLFTSAYQFRKVHCAWKRANAVS